LPGVGKTRAGILLRYFGSLRALREASEEQLAGTPGIPVNVGRVIYNFYHTEAPAIDPGEEEQIETEELIETVDEDAASGNEPSELEAPVEEIELDQLDDGSAADDEGGVAGMAEDARTR
jgi:hypothetical protein